MPVQSDVEYLSVYLAGEFYGIGKVSDGLLSVIAREHADF